VRATRSRDFRAPTLNDLFAPASVTVTAGFADALTGSTPTAQLINSGNPALQPEIAYTDTAGVVFQPHANFNVSLDAYDIQIKNAIVQVSGYSMPIQQACYVSGGSSSYCPLIQRTGGYLNTSPGNVVTAWVQENINAALEKTWGADLELNWNTRLARRPLQLRLLVAWQPHVLFYQDGVNTLDYAATVSAGNNQAGARWRGTGLLRLAVTDRVSIDWMTRWRSNLHLSQDPTLVALSNTNVPGVAFSDLNVAYRFNDGVPASMELYLNVRNVLNQAAPITSFSGTAPEPGLFGGYALGDDPIGRYFSVGLRAKL
jgi:outer membrane receptor protein involved in Fe transport